MADSLGFQLVRVLAAPNLTPVLIIANINELAPSN